MSDQSVCSSAVFVLPSNAVRDQMQLINSEAVIIKYYECACLLSCLRYPTLNHIFSVPQYTVICGLSGSTVLLSTREHKRHDYRKKIIEHELFVLIFYTLFVWKISYSNENSADTAINVNRSPCRITIILVRL
jgi:hypothetical protein